MTDEQIIRLYFDRDQAAIAETDRKYGSYCYSIASNLLGREDSEECVNDTYHAAWTHIPPEVPQSLKAFLGRIVRNLSISRFRRSHAQKRSSGTDVLLSELEDCLPTPQTVETEADSRELSRLISSWLATLSGDDRALFVLRYWHGSAVQDLAEKCGCTPNAVSLRIRRLRKNLKHYLEAKGVSI
jgi:RNA polymerase sigma-70 factor (ECF subfamily)